VTDKEPYTFGGLVNDQSEAFRAKHPDTGREPTNHEAHQREGVAFVKGCLACGVDTGQEPGRSSDEDEIRSALTDACEHAALDRILAALRTTREESDRLRERDRLADDFHKRAMNALDNKWRDREARLVAATEYWQGEYADLRVASTEREARLVAALRPLVERVGPDVLSTLLSYRSGSPESMVTADHLRYWMAEGAKALASDSPSDPQDLATLRMEGLTEEERDAFVASVEGEAT
jgi:hypothetical protein